MAPEQIQGKPRPASDQYALAVVVYEWLSGDRPFHGSFSEVCAQHMFAAPPALREKISTVSPAVEEVVLTAMAKDPSQRFKSVQAFANALEQASRLEQSTGPAIQTSSPSLSAVPLEQPIEKSSLPTPPQSSQALPPSLLQSEENSSASPALEPAKLSSSTPIQPAEISASPWADTVQSETSSRVDEGLTTIAEEAVTEASKGRSTVTGSYSGMMSLWRTWGIGKSQLIAMILGVILYSAVYYPINVLYKQDSPLVVTSISVFGTSIDSGLIVLMSLVLLIPLFFGTAFGPWVGLITILVGTYLGALLAGYNTLSDYYGASWTLLVGLLLIGFISSLALFRTRGRYNTVSAIAYAVAFCAVGILVGTAFATFADIPVSGITVDEAWTRFLRLTLPAAIDLILLPFLLFAYNTAFERLRGAHFSKRT